MQEQQMQKMIKLRFYNYSFNLSCFNESPDNDYEKKHWEFSYVTCMSLRRNSPLLCGFCN